MLASKLNLPLPGGWKDKSGSDSPGEDYAAGVVGETGQVLDQAGKPIARITEGEAKDLIGSVVAPSGEIVNGSGEVIGRAAPLSDEEKKELPTQPEEKRGGVNILGVAKSMKGAYDTINKIPGAGNLAGHVSKGLGFGGASGKEAEGQAGAATEGQTGADVEGQAGDVAEGQDEKAQAPGDADTSKPDLSQADAPQLDESESKPDEIAENAENAEGGAPINMEDKSQADVDPEKAKDTLDDKQAEEDKKSEDEKPDEGKQPEEENGGEGEQPEEEKGGEDKDGGDEKRDEGEQPAEEKAGEGEEVAEGEQPTEEQAEEEEPLDYSVLKDCKVNKGGNVVNSSGNVVGRVSEGNLKDLVGRKPDENGVIWNDSGKVLGKAEPVPQEEEKQHAPFEDFPDAVVETNGTITFEGSVIGRVIEGDAKTLKGKKVDEDGDILDRAGNVIGKAERWEEEEPEPEPEEVDYSVLRDCKVNKAGNVVNSAGNVVGRVSEGKVKDLVGRMPDENGEIWNDSGKVIGKAEPVPLEEAKEPAPFEDFPDAVVETNGTVTFEGNVIGRVIEGDAKKLKGKNVDEEGDILDRAGNLIGKAERWEEEEPEPEEIDYSVLKDCKVNKAGNVVNSFGNVVGRVSEGKLKDLVGRMPDENGEIWNDSGKVIGKAEPVPLEEAKEPAPFEDFPDAVVESDGTVTFEGSVIGRVIEGDAKKLKGKKVDEEGDILDRAGNVIGKAERWEEPEPEPEEEIDMSILAGKRVNKIGNVVDSSGTIYGRLVEGDPKRLAGRMCDKDGNVRSESGDVIGKAELVSEGEREGVKDGPFAELPGCTVAKDGKVVTSSGDVVGRLIEGDSKVLYGRAVDEDGDVLDRNGNKIGRAERWEEPVEERPQNPMCGRKVNREGNVVDADGNIIGKLTSGELSICTGKEIDNDGDVVDYKGNTVGHASLLEDIPPEPEPEETPEEKAKREQEEEDKKLAKRMASCIEQCLDKIRPICSMITEKIDQADRTPKEELDEEQLVKDVKPLIEEGHKILQEANGVIRGLDPDGHIQANAKHKTASREASPEEYHLADVLKELTGTVTETIESAKRKIQDMPHAKKELNPLWALLTEPLGQIIAAVGLLLNGVLELVGRLLNGLGLGGLVNNLLGGLGLTNVLKGLGIGSVVDSLTGQKKKK